MRLRWLPLLTSLLLATGCTWPVRQRTDQTVCRIANQPYDVKPDNTNQVARSAGGNGVRSTTNQQNGPHYATIPNKVVLAAGAPVDVRTAAWLDSPDIGSVPVAPMGAGALNIPPRLPGSETPRVDNAEGQTYPALPPLPVEPRMLPGPDGRPYTLTELQRLAAANSPALRQAVADVQRAIGLWQQARTYANPTGTYFVDPTNNNATTGVQGIGVEQIIKTGGKQKLTAAAAYKDVENAQLALRSARNDLATKVRRAYFGLLVDKETLAVTRAVARFTDEIYQLQARLARGPDLAAYEPTSLRAQAFTTRLAYQQAIATYIYDWKALVAAVGMRQLPLTEVAGQIDRFIPYYDYDAVLAQVLRNHTDVLTARNQVPRAKYNLKLAQVAVIPDLDVSYKFARDFTVAPFGTYQQFQFQMPLAVWDRNKGNIVAAQAALARATEEQHNAQLDLTNRLADAYTNYQIDLYAIDYYRRFILPDLVRYYRGVYARRPLDPNNINLGDVAFAQQNLSQNVTAYLGVLGSLWQSVVTVADFLQTDDLFQMATPGPLPELPDFEELSRWACGHAHLAASCGVTAAPRLERSQSTRPSVATPESVGNALRGVPRTAGGSTIPAPRNATEAVPYRRAAGASAHAPASAASMRRDGTTAEANRHRRDDQ
jgi:cobalt-zinc-cadmium efflux system outer membrane protein